MKRIALVLAATGLLSGLAAAPALAEGVVRPGDMTLSCEALAAEINQLEEAQVKKAQRAESGRKFMGLAGAAFNAAAPSLMARAGNGEGAQIASSLFGQLQAQAAAAPVQETAPAADTSVQARRLERVKSLFAERSC